MQPNPAHDGGQHEQLRGLVHDGGSGTRRFCRKSYRALKLLRLVPGVIDGEDEVIGAHLGRRVRLLGMRPAYAQQAARLVAGAQLDPIESLNTSAEERAVRSKMKVDDGPGSRCTPVDHG